MFGTRLDRVPSVNAPLAVYSISVSGVALILAVVAIEPSTGPFPWWQKVLLGIGATLTCTVVILLASLIKAILKKFQIGPYVDRMPLTRQAAQALGEALQAVKTELDRDLELIERENDKNNSGHTGNPTLRTASWRTTA